MNSEDLKTLVVLDHFPHKIPTRKLLGIYMSLHHAHYIDDMFYTCI